MDKFLEVGQSSHMTRAFKMLAVAAEQPFPKIAAGAWGRFFPAPGGGRGGEAGSGVGRPARRRLITAGPWGSCVASPSRLLARANTGLNTGIKAVLGP